jgi:hypothetical protein
MSDEDDRREARVATEHKFFGYCGCLDGYNHKIKNGCCSGCGGRIVVERGETHDQGEGSLQTHDG